MNKYLISFLVSSIIIGNTFAQSFAINTTGAPADASAMLDIESTTKGMLIPRMTTIERTAVISPATGLIVYDNTLQQFYYYNGTAWTAIAYGNNANNYWTLSGGNIYNNTGTNVGIGLTSPSTYLDITGTNAGTNSLQLRSGNSAAGTSSNQILFGWNGSATYRHAIKTRHNSASATGNNIDFYTWNAGVDGIGTIGTKFVATMDGNGRFGVGTSSPSTLLHASGGNFFVSGSHGSSNSIEVSGSGTKMFFYPRKSALRAGNISGTQWDDTNIGNYSVALGQNPQAKSDYSVAIGEGNIAETSAFAVAIGRENHSTGFASLAMGHFSEATGDYSSSIGLRDTVSGFGASSLGSYNKVTATYAFAAGYSNTVSGVNASALGSTNTVLGTNSIVGGFTSRAEADHSIVVGYTDTSTASATAVFGYRNKVSGFAGFAANDNNKVSSFQGSALGFGNTVSGDIGLAAGIGNTAPSNAETVLGTYATNYTAGSSSAIVASDRLFTIGNGTDNASRSNALVILKNGNTGIGTSSPSNKLQVSVSAGSYSVTDWGVSGGVTVLGYYSGTSAGAQERFTGGGAGFVDIGQNATGDFVVEQSDVANLTVTTGGNTGIGTPSPTSKLAINGSIAVATASTTASLTLNATHYCIIYTGGTGNTFTLPAAGACPGRIYIILNHGTDVLATSVYTTGNASTSTSIAINTALQIVSDGIEWRKIN